MCAAAVELTPGTRLGTCEVRAALGGGGMREVYRARDARLGRDVAGDIRHVRRLLLIAPAANGERQQVVPVTTQSTHGGLSTS
jgi:hypothetical protein